MALTNGEVKAMAMQGSSSEDSYAHNSVVQNHNFHTVAKPLLAEAVDLVINNIAVQAAHARRRHVAIADLGCSYGSNTLDCAQFILQALQQSWAHCAGNDEEMPDIQYFFSDLPSNDFNALFKSLYPYLHQPNSPSPAATGAGQNGLGGTGQNGSPELPKMYAAGVPGSFHGRLFPSASLHLVTCSYALHWLSQVPPSIIDKSSPAWNGGHTWINKASQNVVEAYARQSAIDVKSFLNCRAQELASGGIMFLLLGSMQNKEPLSGHQKPTIWDLINTAWTEMVDEGIITSEEMDMFNMPMYMFCQHELESMLMDVPQLKILHIETKENLAKKEINQTLHQWLGFISSFAKPVMQAYLGKYKVDQLFTKLRDIASKKDNFDSLLAHHILVATLQRV